jgi:hypothetical protein
MQTATDEEEKNYYIKMLATNAEQLEKTILNLNEIVTIN